MTATSKYLFLLWDTEDWYDLPPEAMASDMDEHGKFMQAVADAGAEVLGGEALERSSSSTVVHNPGDGTEALLTDGPFVETKEQLGGYYLIAARDLDQALALARLVPSTHVEVRPVFPIPGDAPVG